MRRKQRVPGHDPRMRTEVRWGIGCLVGAAALGGTLILVVLVAIVIQPPAWLQIVLGVALAAGATSFAWLFASALRHSDEAASPRRPVPLPPQAEQQERRRPPNG